MKKPIYRWLVPVSILCGLLLSPTSNLAQDASTDDDAPPTMSRGKGKKGGGKGKGKGRPTTEPDSPAPDRPTAAPAAAEDDPNTFFASITGIENDRWVTFSRSSSGGGMRGKGRRGGGGGEAETLKLSETALVTSATIAMRTSEFQVGRELGGGVGNAVFEENVQARIVIDGDEITQINVIIADSGMEEGIAVKSRRPPSK